MVFHDLPGSFDIVGFARAIGPSLEYAFGETLTIQDRGEGAESQFSNRAMCLHQDSVLTERPAVIVVLWCEAAPAAKQGGESVMCHNRRFMTVLKRTDPKLYEMFCTTTVIYRSHTKQYYKNNIEGQDILRPAVRNHPITGELLPFFAFNDPDDPRPNYTSRFDGMTQAESDKAMSALDAIMRSKEVMNEYVWMPRDLMLIDNFLITHGRNAYERGATRVLKRVQVGEPLHKSCVPTQIVS
jgi:alpha-ketoglutarate-dependent taurine dioxygenase